MFLLILWLHLVDYATADHKLVLKIQCTTEFFVTAISVQSLALELINLAE